MSQATSPYPSSCFLSLTSCSFVIAVSPLYFLWSSLSRSRLPFFCCPSYLYFLPLSICAFLFPFLSHRLSFSRSVCLSLPDFVCLCLPLPVSLYDFVCVWFCLSVSACLCLSLSLLSLSACLSVLSSFPSKSASSPSPFYFRSVLYMRPDSEASRKRRGGGRALSFPACIFRRPDWVCWPVTWS